MLPALSHWFHLKWADIEDMPQGELQSYLDALHELTRSRR